MKDLKSENLIIIKTSRLRETITKAIASKFLIDETERDSFVLDLIQKIIKDETVILTNLQEVSDGYKNMAAVICERLGAETKLHSDPLMFSRVVSVIFGTVNDLRDESIAATANNKNNASQASNIEDLTKLVGEIHLALTKLEARVLKIEKTETPGYLSKDSEAYISSHQEGP